MLSVLIGSPHPSVPGGVTVFVDVLKRHLRRSHADSFYVGSTGSQESTATQIRRLLTAPVQIAQGVQRNSYDVVHLNPSFDAKAMIRDGLLLLALRAVGYRSILFYLHGWHRDLQTRVMGNFFLRVMTAWVLNRAALVTVLSHDFRDALVQMGVDEKRIVVTRTMFEKHHGLLPPASTTRPFLLFMSRFDREKGGRELIEAFAALAPEYPAYDLILAGDGADASWMKARVAELNLMDRVRFTGYIGGQDKQVLLRDCALFALPTFYRSEGMPVAMLEAMAAGKPLLIGAVGAIRSVIREPDNGVVLKDITLQTVTQGLRCLLQNPALMEKAGALNAQRAAETYEASLVTAEIEQLYQRVASC